MTKSKNLLDKKARTSYAKKKYVTVVINKKTDIRRRKNLVTGRRRINTLLKCTLLRWIILAGLAALTACGQLIGNGTRNNETSFVPVTGICGELPEKILANYKTDFNEYVTVVPEDATRKTIIWKITDSASGGITAADGVFAPTTAGTMTVRATIAGGAGTGDFTDDYTITVIDESDYVAVTGITGVPERGIAGAAVDLGGAVVTPATATYQRIDWTVTNGDGAAIENNKVTAPSTGTLTLRGTVRDPKKVYTKNFTLAIMPLPANWTKVAGIPTVMPHEIQTVCYGKDDKGKGVFVAGSRENDGRIAYSEDGVTWKGLDSSQTTFEDASGGTVYGQFVHVRYLNGAFWAVGGGGHMARSKDGMAWTKVENPGITQNIVDIAYGIVDDGDGNSHGIFVAVGDKGTMSYSLDNGATWTANDQTMHFSKGSEVANFKAIGWGAGKFLAVGQLAKAAYSTDGITWKNISPQMKAIIGTDSGGHSGMSAVAYGNGQYAIAGQGVVALSPDCEKWERIDMADFGFPQGARQGWLNSLIYADGLFVLGGGDGHAACSVDGRNWQSIETNPIFHNFHFINGLAYDGSGKFVAVGATCTADPCPYPSDSLYEGQHSGDVGCIAYSDL
jgi:hypothetical protein